MLQNQLKGGLKHRLLGPISRVPDPVSLEQGCYVAAPDVKV